MQVTTSHQCRRKIFTPKDKTRHSRVCVICGEAATQHKCQNNDLDVLDI